MPGYGAEMEGYGESMRRGHSLRRRTLEWPTRAGSAVTPRNRQPGAAATRPCARGLQIIPHFLLPGSVRLGTFAATVK